jgi:hypothetical protein
MTAAFLSRKATISGEEEPQARRVGGQPIWTDTHRPTRSPLASAGMGRIPRPGDALEGRGPPRVRPLASPFGSRAKESGMTEDVVEADVLCVGGGIAGLMAAIRSGELGAKVVVRRECRSGPDPGGNDLHAGGDHSRSPGRSPGRRPAGHPCAHGPRGGNGPADPRPGGCALSCSVYPRFSTCPVCGSRFSCRCSPSCTASRGSRSGMWGRTP